MLTSSSPFLIRLHVMPATLLLLTLCVYAVGFVIAYIAFLLDRKTTIKAIRASLPTKSESTAGIRSLATTSADRREALLAAAIWPALLLATLVYPS